MRSLLATLLAGAVLVAAGCGGSSSSSGGGVTDTATASLAPQDAGLWISVNTDRASGQWVALEAVLAQIPGAESLIDEALAGLGSNDKKLDFETDIQPALGKEVIAVLPAGSSDPVLLVQPADDAKLKSLLGNSPTPFVTTERDGWTVVAENQKALDGYAAALAKGTLADSDAFATAMEGLPDAALARIFVNGKGLAGALDRASGAASGALDKIPLPIVGNLPQTQRDFSAKTLEQLGTIGLVVSAGDHVVRADGSFESAGALQPESFAPTLLRRVPGDALAAITFSGSEALTKQIRDAVAAAGAGDATAQLQKSLGVSLDDLLRLADGEGVLYLRPGLIIPEITAVLEPKDPARALATLDRVVAKLAGSNGGKVTETTQGGLRFKQVRVSILSLAWGRDGDKLVITTLPLGVEEFDSTGEKLVDTERFKTATADVDLGETTGGFAYVDVKKLTPLVNTIANAASSGADSDPTVKKIVDAVSAIDSVVSNTTVDGHRSLLHAVVRVG